MTHASREHKSVQKKDRKRSLLRARNTVETCRNIFGFPKLASNLPQHATVAAHSLTVETSRPSSLWSALQWWPETIRAIRSVRWLKWTWQLQTISTDFEIRDVFSDIPSCEAWFDNSAVSSLDMFESFLVRDWSLSSWHKGRQSSQLKMEGSSLVEHDMVTKQTVRPRISLCIGTMRSPSCSNIQVKPMCHPKGCHTKKGCTVLNEIRCLLPLFCGSWCHTVWGKTPGAAGDPKHTLDVADKWLLMVLLFCNNQIQSRVWGPLGSGPKGQVKLCHQTWKKKDDFRCPFCVYDGQTNDRTTQQIAIRSALEVHLCLKQNTHVSGAEPNTQAYDLHPGDPQRLVSWGGACLT